MNVGKLDNSENLDPLTGLPLNDEQRLAKMLAQHVHLAMQSARFDIGNIFIVEVAIRSPRVGMGDDWTVYEATFEFMSRVADKPGRFDG